MRLVFHHMPKAGGSSVLGSIAHGGYRHARAGFVHKATDPVGWMTLHPAVNFHSSHYLFMDYEPVEGDLFFTFVRNPVDMLFSGYAYYKHSPTLKPHHDFKPIDAREFIVSMIGFETSNAFVDALLDGEVTGTFVRRSYQLHWHRFHLIGVCEEMTKSLERLGAMCGSTFRAEWVNRTGQFVSLDRSYRRRELMDYFEPEMDRWRDAIENLKPRKKR